MAKFILSMKWIRVRKGYYNLRYYGPAKRAPRVGALATIEGGSGRSKTVEIQDVVRWDVNSMTQWVVAEYQVG